MNDWVWVCKNTEELVFDVLVIPVATKRKPIAKVLLKAGLLAVNGLLYLKNLQIM
tara:strand:+ start:66 stop:230 length:165 start_codon:yes stop_codon:yes gene_type:complete